jgi:hypothetical protein
VTVGDLASVVTVRSHSLFNRSCHFQNDDRRNSGPAIAQSLNIEGPIAPLIQDCSCKTVGVAIGLNPMGQGGFGGRSLR